MLATLRQPARFWPCPPNGRRSFHLCGSYGYRKESQLKLLRISPLPPPTTSSGSQVTAVPIFSYDSGVSSLRKCFVFNWLYMCLRNHFCEAREHRSAPNVYPGLFLLTRVWLEKQFSPSFHTQLILEQEFELHKSTYMWIFFNEYVQYCTCIFLTIFLPFSSLYCFIVRTRCIIHITGLLPVRLLVNSGLLVKFWVSPNPCIVQGPTGQNSSVEV